MAAINGKQMGVQSLTEAEMMDMAMETRRRRDAIGTGGANTLEDGGSSNTPFHNEDQRFVMVNMANTGLRPRSSFPAFRILGFFPTPADLSNHLPVVVNADMATCDVRMVTAREFYSIPVDRESLVEDQQAKVNRNLIRHHQQLQADVTEFVDHKTQLTQGRKPVNMQSDTLQDAVDRINRNKQLNASPTDASFPPLVLNVDDDMSTMENGALCSSGSEDTCDASKNGANESTSANEDEHEGMSAAMPGTSLETLEKNDDKDSVELWLERESSFIDPDDGGVSESKTTEGEATVASVLVGLEHGNFETPVVQVESAATDLHVPMLSVSAEMRNQKFASLALLKDYEAGTEPAVCFLGGFVTQDEAVAFNKYVASKHIDDHDLHVVEMYVWIYPHVTLDTGFDRVEQVYRNKEQDSIMRQQRTSSTKVEDFTRYFESRGLNVPAIDVPADLSSSVPV